MKPKVFVVMPVHDRLKFTKRCLGDLGRQKYKDLEIIVIDDGSTDGTFEYIRRYQPQVHLIRGDGNLWWSRAVYLGIEYALAGARDKDYILLMNNDCFFGSELVEQLVKTARKHPRALIGSLCTTTTKPERVVEAGIRINWPKGVIQSVAETMSTDPKRYRKTSVIDQLDALPGKGTLVPVGGIRKFGTINYKRLPHYIADYEFSNRAKRAGYQLLVDVHARIKHVWEATGYKPDTYKGVSGCREAWVALFDRRSMMNIIDWCNFLLLACPGEYRLRNFYITFLKIVRGATQLLFKSRSKR